MVNKKIPPQKNNILFFIATITICIAGLWYTNFFEKSSSESKITNNVIEDFNLFYSPLLVKKEIQHKDHEAITAIFEKKALAVAVKPFNSPSTNTENTVMREELGKSYHERMLKMNPDLGFVSIVDYVGLYESGEKISVIGSFNIGKDEGCTQEARLFLRKDLINVKKFTGLKIGIFLPEAISEVTTKEMLLSDNLRTAIIRPFKKRSEILKFLKEGTIDGAIYKVVDIKSDGIYAQLLGIENLVVRPEFNTNFVLPCNVVFMKSTLSKHEAEIRSIFARPDFTSRFGINKIKFIKSEEAQRINQKLSEVFDKDVRSYLNP